VIQVQRFIWLGPGLLVLLVAQLGCSQPSALPVSEEGPRYFGALKPVEGQVFRFNNGTEPELLDPGLMSGQPDGRIARAIFEGLITAHPKTLEPVPGQAWRWEISEDLLTYTFYLRPGLVWSDGNPITAEDFRWSLVRVLEPAVGSRYSGLLYPIKNAEAYNKSEISDPALVGVSAPNDSTIVIELTNPTPYFLFSMTFYTFLPVPRPAVETYGDRWTRTENIVTNGAFRINEYRQGSHFELIRSPSYWDAENVKLDRIIAYSVEELNTAVNLYKSGIIDWNPSGYIPTPFVPFMSTYDDFSSAPYQGVYFYSLNTTEPPLDDVWVRRALSLAVDRVTLVEKVLKGTRIPWGNFTPSGYVGYEKPEGVKFEPELAREYLARAGYPNGEGFPKIEVLFNTSEDHRRIAEAIQAMWRETLNISVQLSNQEWASYLEATTNLRYQIARRSWIGDYPDPSTFLNCFLSGDGNNRTGWSNAEYDRLIKTSESEPDPAVRMKMLAEAESILLDDGVVIAMYHYVSTELVKPYVKGWYPTALDFHPLKYISIDENWQQEPPAAADPGATEVGSADEKTERGVGN